MRPYMLPCAVLFAGTVLAAADPASALRELDAIQPAAVRLAIDDMAAQWPDRYDARRHREALAAFEARRTGLAEALGRGEVAAEAEARLLLSGVRAALLANPLLDFDRLIVLKRGFPKPEVARKAMGAALGVGSLNAHTSDTIPVTGHFDDELVVLSNLRGAVAETKLYVPGGRRSVIDPVLDFDASRLMFARVGDKEKNWRVFEMNLDGGGLRQVTPDDGDDVGHFDPCYLPDGRVIFASTAVYQGLPCEFGGREMVCLYLFDPRDGSIRQLTFEQDSDWCPTPLNNGRVLYLRWEYTDQSHSNSRMLFHMNPDGTDQREYRGSGSWFPGSFFYAKPLPGDPRRIIGVAGGHHGTPRSGRLMIMDPGLGRRDAEGIVQEIPYRGRKIDPIVRDRLVDGVWPQFIMPAPLSANYHLVAAKLQPDALWGLYLVDVFDNMTLLMESEGAALLWPVPVQKRVRPPAIPDRVNLKTNTAEVVIADVQAGPGLDGVPRGTVKALRVIEYYFSHRGMGGLYGTLGLDGPWDVKRILGTVPVENDGSAHFTIPANSPVAVQPLDEHGQALQLMRSWMVGMPGEKMSCIGCHENQSGAPAFGASKASLREASAIAPWNGPARGFSFEREVQPVLDRYCVGCHDQTQPAIDGTKPETPYLKGDVRLTNWTSQMSGRWAGGGKFTEAYFQLQRFLRRPGIEGDRRMFTPMDYHFETTELAQLLRKGHYKVQLDAASWDRLAAWHDLNAPFYGTWSEIPGVGCTKVTNVNDRALELRKKYVPMGPFPDYEEVPATPAYDTTPVKPPAFAKPAPANVSVPGWPFTAETAAKRQKESVPGGKDVTLQLLPPEKVAGLPALCRYVRVSAGPAKWLSIAETKVFVGGQNIAVGRRASQSSTYGQGEARLAVDGNTEGVFLKGSMTHTDEGPDEWWEVDLGQLYPVEKIELWNRTDAAPERLAGVTVDLLDEKRANVWSTITPASVGTCIVLAEPAGKGLVLNWIPPGEFVLGDAAGHADEQPRVAKIPQGFWMSVCEINNAQFRLFDPQHESRTEDRHGYQFGAVGYDQDQPEQPAVRVSWDEAMAFCRWLSAKTGRKVALPTEEQWEWACRAGAATPFWFGGMESDYSPFANVGDRRLRDFAADTALDGYSAQRPMKNPNRYDDWMPRDDRFDDGGFVTQPVGGYRPNPWGLFDLHGNAWEWTASNYGDTGRKVVRGGSWFDRPFRCTASYRLPYRPYQRVYNVGFRIVIEE